MVRNGSAPPRTVVTSAGAACCRCGCQLRGLSCPYRGVGLGGGPQPDAVHQPVVVYQCTQALVIFSTWARPRSGPSRNGDPSLAHPALYTPISVSARALS